jgi:hypothetical protein
MSNIYEYSMKGKDRGILWQTGRIIFMTRDGAYE